MLPPVSSAVLSFSASPNSAWVDFRADDDASTTQLTIRIATSFISTDQATVNQQREVGIDRSIETLISDAKEDWHAVTARVNIEEISPTYTAAQSTDLLTTFYSAVYRASLFPRQLTEVNNAAGETVHWSPYTTSGVGGGLRWRPYHRLWLLGRLQVQLP